MDARFRGHERMSKAATNRTTMRREFTVIVERDEEGFYVASVPALAGCHTQARSLDELVARVQKAIAVCLED